MQIEKISPQPWEECRSQCCAPAPQGAVATWVLPCAALLPLTHDGETQRSQGNKRILWAVSNPCTRRKQQQSWNLGVMNRRTAWTEHLKAWNSRLLSAAGMHTWDARQLTSSRNHTASSWSHFFCQVKQSQFFKGLWLFGKQIMFSLWKKWMLLFLVFGVMWIDFQTIKHFCIQWWKRLPSKMCSQFQEYWTPSFTKQKHNVVQHGASSLHSAFNIFTVLELPFLYLYEFRDILQSL